MPGDEEVFRNGEAKRSRLPKELQIPAGTEEVSIHPEGSRRVNCRSKLESGRSPFGGSSGRCRKTLNAPRNYLNSEKAWMIQPPSNQGSVGNRGAAPAPELLEEQRRLEVLQQLKKRIESGPPRELPEPPADLIREDRRR